MKASILKFLETHGEGTDAEIARALRMPAELVKSEVLLLSSAGDVVCCSVTRIVDGNTMEGVSCRLSSRAPTPKRRPKPVFNKVTSK